MTLFEQLGNSSTCERSSAWRSSEEIAFAATMYIKRSGRQLHECVKEPHSVQGLYAVAVK